MLLKTKRKYNQKHQKHSNTTKQKPQKKNKIKFHAFDSM